jgi:hypothetical protein
MQTPGRHAGEDVRTLDLLSHPESKDLANAREAFRQGDIIGPAWEASAGHGPAPQLTSAEEKTKPQSCALTNRSFNTTGAGARPEKRTRITAGKSAFSR